jgi:hypothetical protein
MPDTANVFIAHRHEDDAELHAMRELLLSRNFTIRDSSINSSRPNEAHDPDYIKTQILAPRIQWASTLVVLISPNTLDHWWVDWEIEYAHKLGRRIVGVWAHGAAECDVPEALDRYADAVVGWQADRIIDAITGVLNNYESSDGAPRAPRELARVTC